LEDKNGFIPERSPIFSLMVSLERTVSGSKASKQAGGVGGKFVLSPIFSRWSFVSEEFTEAEMKIEKKRRSSLLTENIHLQ
jgi:hypothetical protein